MLCVNACEQERSFNLRVCGLGVPDHAPWKKVASRVAVRAGENLWT